MAKPEIKFGEKENSWEYTTADKRKIVLITPAQMDADAWRLLNGYIQILKPVGLDMPATKSV
jgi:hypothetical protein